MVDFTLMRFFGYYSTSHNNGALAWQMDHNLSAPFHTMQWFWNFPLLGHTPLSYQSVTGVDPMWEYTRLLNRYGSAEFNNPGGVFARYARFRGAGGAGFLARFWFPGGPPVQKLFGGRLGRPVALSLLCHLHSRGAAVRLPVYGAAVCAAGNDDVDLVLRVAPAGVLHDH